MNDWFTVEKLAPDTFAISEYGHWEQTHCYLLCGTSRALLVDSGLGVADIRAVTNRLTSLPLLVATTHVHWDHIGGHKNYTDSEIAVHEQEKDWLSGRFPLPLSVVKHNLTREPCEFPADFSIDHYQIFQGIPQRLLHDGDSITLGNRKLQVMHTPGHSPGHCCFYEPARGYLFSGDLIYGGCLDAFYPTTDAELFWQSVKKIQPLKIARIFPGHHRLDIPVRIIGEIERAFHTLAEEGKLERGAGIFDFGAFQIHV